MTSSNENPLKRKFDNEDVEVVYETKKDNGITNCFYCRGSSGCIICSKEAKDSVQQYDKKKPKNTRSSSYANTTQASKNDKIEELLRELANEKVPKGSTTKTTTTTTTSTKSASSSTNNDRQDVTCPVCNKLFKAISMLDMDKHVEECLSSGILEEEKQKNTNVPQTTPGVVFTSNSPTVKRPRIKIVRKPEYSSSEEDDYKPDNYYDSDEEIDRSSDGDSVPTTPTAQIIPKLVPAPAFSPLPSISTILTNTLDSIKCPYYPCTQILNSTTFPLHVFSSHGKDPVQGYICPLCSINFPGKYHVNRNTHLYKHVIQCHSLAPPVPTSTVPTTITVPTPTPGEKKSEEEPSFLEEVLQKSLPEECAICFETFESGQTIARLLCFCVYHKPCLSQWLQKSNRCPVHETVNVNNK